MFRRRTNQRRYSPEQTTHWLSWLAIALTRDNQAVFYLENLDFGWLPTRTERLRRALESAGHFVLFVDETSYDSRTRL